mgnify:FL=1
MLQPYSQKCAYALRALAYVAANHPDCRFQAGALCKDAGVPEPFTRKVLHVLVEGGLLLAHRGPGGGYSLSRPPDKITLWEIIGVVDEHRSKSKCVMGFRDCGSSTRCPIHHATGRCAAVLAELLGESTLAELSRSVALRDRDSAQPSDIELDHRCQTGEVRPNKKGRSKCE